MFTLTHRRKIVLVGTSSASLGHTASFGVG